METGSRFRKGEVLARTGNDGTANPQGYYGAAGFYHLHMTAYWGDSPEFSFKKTLLPRGGQWLDPLALFKGKALDSKQLRQLAVEEKQVAIAYQTSDGQVFPRGARIIWPYLCSPR